jgi:hypothetical protein
MAILWESLTEVRNSCRFCGEAWPCSSTLMQAKSVSQETGGA